MREEANRPQSDQPQHVGEAAQPSPFFAQFESEGLDISHIFSKLSALKLEIRKRQNIQIQNYERLQGNQEELTKSLKKALQTQFDLNDSQDKLCPLIPRTQGVSH